jgi:AbrB family looped-hinge helix DNA binding protein
MKEFSIPKMYGAVTVGERGQVVIPAKIRKLFGIKTGEKLIVFAKRGGPIGFIPADQFSQFLEQATGMLSKLKKSTA